MAEVKWVKISTDLFDNEKIKYLLTLKDGNEMVLCWIKLLLLAGKCNEKGGLFLSKNVEIPEKFLQKYLGISPKKHQKYMEIFQKLSMIFCENNAVYIANWDKYQSAEKLETMRENGRKRVQKFRDKNERYKNVTNRYSNALDIDIDIDIDKKEINKEKEKEKKQEFKNLFLN